MKDIERSLVGELLKNSRISDRELAKRLGVSQPTVSRVRLRLEKGGVIRGYTMIPCLSKLGYQIMAATFVRLRGNLNTKEADQLRKRAEERFRNESFAESVVMFERGMGFGYTGVIISFHENYASFAEFLRMIKQYPVLDSDVKSFLSDLQDKVHYRPLTFTPLAQHLLTLKKGKNEGQSVK